MIAYQWCEALSPDDRGEVLELVRIAAEYDDEAGFSAIAESDVVDRDGRSAESDSSSADGARVLHLPIKARRGLATGPDVPWMLVAYLHLAVGSDGLGVAQFVVHPDYRSRGIATQLVEELGLDVDAEGGWAGTGARALRAWAYGSHPATERLTARFGVPAVSRLWTLLRHLSGPWAEPLPELESPEAYRIVPSRPVADPDVTSAVDAILVDASLPAQHRENLSVSATSGQAMTAIDEAGRPVGVACYDPTLRIREELRAAWVGALVVTTAARGAGLGSVLLVRALEALREAGAQVALLRIDPDDERALRMCRLLSFEQDEAHACFQVGRWSQPVEFHR
ncbi:GNAT family N-acetyltransferase [Rhodococcus sp. NPDC004095]